ncbi:MAG: 4'-phosphopantetheinyl transferase superfamily protein, partial [Elusimicrobiota bacterium]
RHFQDIPGQNPDPALLPIANDPQGAPSCSLPYTPHLSISHCALGAVCALGRGGRRVGIDWEATAPREPGLEKMFARPGEPISETDRDEDITRLWAAKEAVSKLLGLGLNCPPLDLQIRPHLRLYGRALARWEELGRPDIELTLSDRPGSVFALAYTGEP